MAQAKLWTPEDIRTKLQTDDRWLFKGIVALFERQTDQEKKVEDARITNNQGFNKPDSHKLTYYAKWILKHGALTGFHLEDARKRVLKYSGQLTKIANKEI